MNEDKRSYSQRLLKILTYKPKKQYNNIHWLLDKTSNLPRYFHVTPKSTIILVKTTHTVATMRQCHSWMRFDRWL